MNRPPRPPRPAGHSDNGADRGPCATAASVAGLAREVETARRALADLAGLPGRVADVAALVARLAEDLTTSLAAFAEAGPGEAPPRVQPSWLGLPGDAEPDTAAGLLLPLAGWVGAVFLAYPDGARALPGCWLWHPHIVEELLWLCGAWHGAYTGPKASPTAVGDWHDRQRPGAARRIGSAAGTCSVENHQPGRAPTPGEHDATGGVPAGEAIEPIAFWWAVNRHAEPPPPSSAQLDAAAAARPKGTRR